MTIRNRTHSLQSEGRLSEAFGSEKSNSRIEKWRAEKGTVLK
jgi:hypothetical protein